LDRLDAVADCRVTICLALRGRLDRQALRAALDQIVSRHEVLRTTFPSVQGKPLHTLGPPDCGFALIEEEVEEQCVLEQFDQEAREGFDLSSGPLVRGRLLRVSEQNHFLLVTLHRIIADRWSLRVLARELITLYRAFALGQGVPLPPLELQYADYASWQRHQVTSDVLDSQLEFWKQELMGAPEMVDLPTDRPRSAVQLSAAGRLPLRLSADLTEKLQKLAQQKDVTLFVTLLSGWAVLLGRWSGQEEVVIGTWITNRFRADIEPLIGPFETTAALRVRLHGDPSAEQLLKKTAATVMEACLHKDLPFEEVVEALRPFRSQSQVFRMTLGLNDSFRAIDGSDRLQLAGLKFSEMFIENSKTKFDMSVTLSEEEGALVGTLEYAKDLFDRETISRLAVCWMVLLEKMVMGVELPISRLSMLTATERNEVLFGFSNTTVAYPQDRLIHGLFEDQVRRTPDAVAVSYNAQHLTYAELNGRANQLARYLRDLQIGPERLVGLCVERGLEMIVGLLGILKSGGAYLPLDPSYPFERLAYMLRDAAPRVLLTQDRLRTSLPPTAAEVIPLDSRWSEIAKQTEENLDPRSLQLTPQQLAYVIYTSGSTGEPKGVAAEHRGMVNRIAAQQIIGPFSGDDICCQKTSLAFVDAIFEILGPLSYGRPLVVATTDAAKDVQKIASLIEREHITRLVTVPSLAQSLLENRSAQSLRSLRSWTLSGEELNGDLLRKLQQQLPNCNFINLYGSSEVAADVTYYASRHFEGVRVPIGRPIANMQIYILDRHLQPVPIGVAGEIYIGGVGVARGYLNRPELTVDRFIAHPFSTIPEARLYKSGDLGRWRKDGNIEFLGRDDQQVKLRGFRIELEEIQTQLARHPWVKHAVVVVREDTPGAKRLVAYITGGGRSAPSPEELRAHLKVVLPDYMIPSTFVILESFPLTPNGKLDRLGLPAPNPGEYVSQRYDPPQGDLEAALAEIWQSILPVERVGRHDNFFELGGHSLLIVQMLDRLRRLGLFAEVRSIYANPTLVDLARAVAGETDGRLDVPPNLIPLECEEITPQMLPLVELEPTHIERIAQAVPGGMSNIKDIYPLAPLQEGMLFHHLLNEHGGDTYVRLLLLSLSSRASLEDFIEAVQQVVDRHDVLRTAVLWDQLPQPVQVVYRRVALPVEQLALDGDHDPIEQLKEKMMPGRQRLELRVAPLIRLQVAPDAAGIKWYVLLQTHHLVCDNQSLEIMLEEVLAHLDGRAQRLPEPVAYRNHVGQALAHARKHDAEAFFRNKLGEIDEPTAPFGLLDVHGDGRRVEEVYQTLESALAQRIRAQARLSGVSSATLFHAAWALVVSCTSGRNDVVYGTVLLGRLQGSAGAKRILGMFINTLPLLLRLRAVTVRELVEQTQRGLMELLDYEQAPLAVAQSCSAIVGSAPLFSTLLNYRHSTRNPEAAQLEVTSGIQVLALQEWTNYPIAISVDDQGDGFVLTAQIDRRIDPNRMMGYICTALQSLVDALEGTPQRLALELPILPESEHQRVTQYFNATRTACPHERLVHELFEEQVKSTPEGIAVVCAQRRLSYSELNARANQLAHYLRRQGAGPDRPVGLCAERSLDMVVGMLGILKAGGAYVPLDPSYPAERLGYMLADSAPSVLLTQEGLKEGLPRCSARVVTLDKDWDEIDTEPQDNLAASRLGLRPQHLAYVIYTSGSTGQPKGVMVEHRNLVNLLKWHCVEFALSPGHRCSCVAAVGFDAIGWEMWPALIAGATVVLAPSAATRDPEALLTWWSKEPLDVSFLPTPMAELAFTGNIGKAQLHTLLVGGDRLHQRPKDDTFRLINNYGPTETTVVATSGCIQNDDSIIHIGRPIHNTQVYILNKNMLPVPIGVVGEIYIGGAGVARGYLNRPELTQERFIADPFNQSPQSRLYKSGDLAQWQADGTIKYEGRSDQQVKLRGFRIELGEIEIQLARQGQVKEAVVIARESRPGEVRLVAYITCSSGGRPSVEELRAYLKTVLPEYMVPSAYVIVESLPLTPNGKLDHRALPAPDLEAYGSPKFEAPLGKTEKLLARLWEDLLRVERVGRHDNFFELGGNSLSAMQVTVRIRSSLSTEVPISMLFACPTVKQIAAEVDRIQESRVLARRSIGEDKSAEELLNRIESMSERRAHELLRQLEMGERP